MEKIKKNMHEVKELQFQNTPDLSSNNLGWITVGD